jgi:hypothetical protein
MGARGPRLGSPLRSPIRILTLGLVLLVTGLYMAMGSSSLAATPPAVSDVEVTLTAGSIDVTNLTFVDTVNLATAAGTVATLRFDTDDATIHGLSLALPCFAVSELGGLTAGIVTQPSDTTTAAQGLTLYATDLQASVLGNPVHYSVSDISFPPPPAGTTLLASGALTSPTIVFVLAQAPALGVSGSTTSATFCTPGGAGANVVAPAAKTKPSAPTPTTSETPAPQPTETSTPPAPEPTQTTTPSPEPAPSPTATEPAPSPTPTDPVPTPTPTDTVTPDPTPSPSV